MKDIRKGVLDILPFPLQVSSSGTTTYNTQIFWAWAIRNQWLWAVLSLSIVWERRERLKQCQSPQDSLAPCSLSAAWLNWLDWLNNWLNAEIKKMRMYKVAEEGSVSGDCKDENWLK